MMTPSDMPALELRILTGTHAGARCELDAAHYLIGSGEDCDIVLADAGLLPEHARLERGPGLWRLHWLAAGTNEALPPAPVGLEPGLAVAIGPVILAVDQPGAPWPTLEQLVLVQSEAGVADPDLRVNEPAHDDASEELAAETSATAGDMAPAGNARARWRRWVPSMPPRTARRALAAASLLGVAVLLVGIFVSSSRTDTGNANAASQAAATAAAAAIAKQPEPSAKEKEAIDAVVRDLALTRRVTVEPVGTGWRVRGHYLDDLSAERLAVALARLVPRPSLRITNVQDLPLDVADALVRLRRDAPATVTAQPLGDGRLRLQGTMASASERDALMSALREAFPGVEWDAAVMVPEEAGSRLLAELREAGWDVSGSWQDDRYVMRVRLQQQQLGAWEQGLAQAVSRNAVPMKAIVEFNPAAPAGGAVQASLDGPRLPFQVRSVVASDPAWLVLEGGSKLMQGGSHLGWRFVSLDAQRLIFDNGTQRAAIPR